MSRLLAMVVLVALLGASGAAIYTHIQNDGFSTFVHRLGFKQNGRSAAEDALLSAGSQLGRDHDAYGTYTRTDLSRLRDVQVVFATESAYCIQIQKGGRWYHMAGPEGVPLDGSC